MPASKFQTAWQRYKPAEPELNAHSTCDKHDAFGRSKSSVGGELDIPDYANHTTRYRKLQANSRRVYSEWDLIQRLEE
jgi:hypothetical protein